MRRRYGSLEEISAAVSSCTKCPLCKTRKMSVPGNGSYNAKIMFIGEAPGRSEDLRGRPFAGSAGKKLDDALKSAGLSRDEVYITNVVKCRPPKNRVPEEIERAACSRYLQDEIAALKPETVCVMGNTALQSVLGACTLRHLNCTRLRKYVHTVRKIHICSTTFIKHCLIPLCSSSIRMTSLIFKMLVCLCLCYNSR